MKQIFIYLLMMFNQFILMMIMILISVAFLTLLERKLLSYLQLRKGPNKVGVWGMLQPFSDAIKLLTKEFFFMVKINMIYYLISPMFMFLLNLMMWMIYPFLNNLLSFDLGLIYLLCCFSFSSYGLLITGWSSNSSYSMLGAVRSLAQSISYEVSLSIIMISPFIILESFNFMDFFYIQYKIWLSIYLLPLLLIFFFSVMAELNRTPFDFSEGESELVSGFNVEYMSSGFILIFLAEYMSILFLSMMVILMFLGGNYLKISFYLKILLLSCLVIWLRGTLPRFRYDLLMYLSWLIILPMSLMYLMNVYMCKIFFFK